MENLAVYTIVPHGRGADRAMVLPEKLPLESIASSPAAASLYRELRSSPPAKAFAAHFDRGWLWPFRL